MMEEIELIMGCLDEEDRLMMESEKDEMEYYDYYGDEFNRVIDECVEHDIDIRDVDNEIYQNILSTNEYPVNTHKNHFMRLIKNDKVERCIANNSTATLKSLLEMGINFDHISLFNINNLEILELLLDYLPEYRIKSIQNNLLFSYCQNYEKIEMIINKLEIDYSIITEYVILNFLMSDSFKLIAGKIKKFNGLYYSPYLLDSNIIVLYENGFDINEKKDNVDILYHYFHDIGKMEIFLSLGLNPYISNNIHNISYLDNILIKLHNNKYMLIANINMLFKHTPNIEIFIHHLFDSYIWSLVFSNNFNIIKYISKHINNIYYLMHNHITNNLQKFKSHNFKKIKEPQNLMSVKKY